MPNSYFTCDANVAVIELYKNPVASAPKGSQTFWFCDIQIADTATRLLHNNLMFYVGLAFCFPSPVIDGDASRSVVS